jgi:hypothetical protein
MVHEPDAIVAMADGRITYFGPAERGPARIADDRAIRATYVAGRLAYERVVEAQGRELQTPVLSVKFAWRSTILWSALPNQGTLPPLAEGGAYPSEDDVPRRNPDHRWIFHRVSCQPHLPARHPIVDASACGGVFVFRRPVPLSCP